MYLIQMYMILGQGDKKENCPIKRSTSGRHHLLVGRL